MEQNPRSELHRVPVSHAANIVAAHHGMSLILPSWHACFILFHLRCPVSWGCFRIRVPDNIALFSEDADLLLQILYQEDKTASLTGQKSDHKIKTRHEENQTSR